MDTIELRGKMERLFYGIEKNADSLRQEIEANGIDIGTVWNQLDLVIAAAAEKQGNK